MSIEKETAEITFRNDFLPEEIAELRHELYEIQSRDKDGKKMTVDEIKGLFALKDKKEAITVATTKGNYDNLLTSFEGIQIPYYLVLKEKGIPVRGVVFDGANAIETMYDKNGELLGRMDAISEAISLLENDEEIKALVLLNHFCIRTDIKDMPRLTKKVVI